MQLQKESLKKSGLPGFVSDARRDGDRGGSQVVAETAKTVGNAGYGQFIMDSSRHLDVRYEEDESKVCRAINSLFLETYKKSTMGSMK